MQVPKCNICHVQDTRPLKKQPKNATQVKYTSRCDSCADKMCQAFKRTFLTGKMPMQDASTQCDIQDEVTRKRTAEESFHDSNMWYDSEFMIEHIKTKKAKIQQLEQELQACVKKVQSQVDSIASSLIN